MSVEELLRTLWRRKLTVFLTALVATVATYLVSSSLDDVYQARATLVVSVTGQVGTDFEATQSAQVLAKTYAELIQSDNVAALAAQRIPGQQTPEDVLEDMSFTPIEETRLLVVQAEAGSPEEAADLANVYADVFTDFAEAELPDETQGSVAVADEARPPTSPVRPRPGLYTGIMLVVSLFAGSGLALLRDRLDRRLGSEEEAADAVGLPIIARVPRASLAAPGSLQPSDDARFLDAFRVLWANLQFATRHGAPTSILVTSPGSGEGKSTTAMALARTAAEQGTSVLLIEADLRRPVLDGDGRADGEGARPGLTRLLERGIPLENVVQRTGVSNLYVLPAGAPAANPARLLTPTALHRLVEEAGAWSDLVILDSPPLSVGPDALLLSRAAAATLLVVSGRLTVRGRAVGAARELRRAEANVLGLVFNEAPGSQQDEYYGAAPRGRRRAPANSLAEPSRRD